jgi:hypothetical protein
MPELSLGITVVEGLFAFIVVLLIGDWLGHKFGRRRLLTWAGIAALVILVAFAIFAAVLIPMSQG